MPTHARRGLRPWSRRWRDAVIAGLKGRLSADVAVKHLEGDGFRGVYVLRLGPEGSCLVGAWYLVRKRRAMCYADSSEALRSALAGGGHTVEAVTNALHLEYLRGCLQR